MGSQSLLKFRYLMLGIFICFRGEAASIRDAEASFSPTAWRLETYRQMACGPLSLLATLHFMGITVPDEKKQEMLEEASRKGTTLFRLQQFAQACGVHAKCVEMPVEQLRAANAYAIVNLDNYRFVAVTGYTSNGIEIVEPLQSPSVVSEDVFSKHYIGKHALLLSKEDFPAVFTDQKSGRAEGPKLTPSSTVLAVGRISKREWVASIDLYNDGGAPLHITQVIPSCSCMKPVLDGNVVEPGGHAKLTVTGHEEFSGSIARDILIKSDDASKEPRMLPVRGYVDPAIMLDRSLIEIPASLFKTGGELSLGFATDKAVLQKDVVIVVDNMPQVSARCELEGGTGKLYLKVAGGGKAGWIRGKVNLHLAGQGTDDAPSMLQVISYIPPEISTIPASIRFGGDGADGLRRAVQLHSQTPIEAASFEWSDARFQENVTALMSNVSAHDASIVLKISSEEALRKLPPVGTLTIHTKSGSVVLTIHTPQFRWE